MGIKVIIFDFRHQSRYLIGDVVIVIETHQLLTIFPVMISKGQKLTPIFVTLEIVLKHTKYLSIVMPRYCHSHTKH